MFRRYRNFLYLEATMIDHLDTCISARGMGDSEFRKLFNDILKDLFESHEYKPHGIKFVANLSDLLCKFTNTGPVLTFIVLCTINYPSLIANITNCNYMFNSITSTLYG